MEITNNIKLLNEADFKAVHEHKNIALYTLRNKNGMVAQITNYGAIVASLFVPDKHGVFADVVQGYDSIEQYTKGNSIYMGAVCGRCANRIANGTFAIDGKIYKLAINNGPNHLHGGIKGFDKVVWDVVSASDNKLVLAYFSPDGEEGYPGNLKVQVTYSITEQNELRLDYYATTDKTTVVNLASHSYFNLAGEGTGSIANHELMINAGFFTPVNESSAPTGEIRSVENSPMDFKNFKPIGRDIDAPDTQIEYGAGYDHNWVLEKPVGLSGLAATAYEPVSGRLMEVFTTQPGVQLYTANWVNNENGKFGKKYNRREAFCLETQHFADAVNLSQFPSTILKPNEMYMHACIYKFLVKK